MNRTLVGRVSAAALVAMAVTPPLGATEPSHNWPQWRGPAGQGISTDARVPLEWTATENVLWKTPIPGRGHSQPIVWGNRLFLTTAIEGEVVPAPRP